MELAEALTLVVARTGHRRYRELCDPAHPDFNPAYGAVVLELAAGAPAPRPEPTPDPAPITLDVIAAMKACPHWRKATDCGCGVNRCALGRGRSGAVTHRDCAACLAPG